MSKTVKKNNGIINKLTSGRREGRCVRKGACSVFCHVLEIFHCNCGIQSDMHQMNLTV